MASGLPSHVDEGDLVSYGLLGLIGAIERFDLEREIKFETFAVARIKGAIIDELRSLDWVPRSVRARARDVERAHAALEAELGRAPTDEEMAVKLEIIGGGVPRRPAPDRELVGARPRRPVDVRRSRRRRRPDLGAGHDPGPERARSRVGGEHCRAQGPPRGRDRIAARARAPRDRPLLLREPDPPRDRRGPRRHRVARLPAPHEVRAGAPLALPGRSRSKHGTRLRPTDRSDRFPVDGPSGSRPDPKRRPDRAPRQRQDQPGRGDPVRGGEDQPPGLGGRRARRSAITRTTSTSGRCRSTRPSPRSTSTTARST